MRVSLSGLGSGGQAKSGFPHRFRNNYKLAGFSQTTPPLSTENSPRTHVEDSRPRLSVERCSTGFSAASKL
jgi:hypothetical protein